MGSLREFFNGLTGRKCCLCGKQLVDGERHYIEYPNDLYCTKCAAQHPDYRR